MPVYGPEHPAQVQRFIYDGKMFSIQNKQLSLTDCASLLLIPLALVAAAIIASRDVLPALPSAAKPKPHATTPLKDKLIYSNYLFDNAIADKKFDSDDVLLKKYSTFGNGCDKKSLKKVQKALLAELDNHENTYPLSRLVLVNSLLQEPIANFSDLSQKTSGEDFSLALRMGDALNSEHKLAAMISTDEINAAFTDKIMREAFLVRSRHTGDERRRLALQDLKADCAKIKSYDMTLFLVDIGTFICGFFCVIALLWNLRKKRTIEAGAGLGAGAEAIAYPNPKPVIYSVFSICLAVFCSSILCLLTRYALQEFVSDALARSIETLLFAPAMMFMVYEFSIRQQGLSVLEGFRFRLALASTKMGAFIRTASTAFFMVSLLSIALGIIAVLLPSNVTDASSMEDLFDSINRSTIIPQILTITIFAPIAEEALFRGYLYSALRTKLGCVSAAVLSASLFTLAHFHANPYTAGHHFMLGIVTVYLFQKTKSIIPGILLHSFWNIFVTYNAFSSITAIYPIERIFF